MDLKIVVCTINDDNFISLSLSEKLEIINNLINSQFNNNTFHDQHELSKQDISGIFVLPEYFFNQKRSYGAPIPLNLDEKTLIKNNFLKMSHIPGLLLIPGSFSYIRELTPSKKEHIFNKYNIFKTKELGLYESKTQQKLSKNICFELEIIDEVSNYVKNSAFCFFNEEYMKSNKRESITDSIDGVVFIPGMVSPVIHYKDVVIGLSICRDTVEKYLDNYSQHVDLEIILSDWITWDQIKQGMNYERPVIHASTKKEYTGIMDSQKNIIRESNQEDINGLLMTTFNVGLDLTPTRGFVQEL